MRANPGITPVKAGGGFVEIVVPGWASRVQLWTTPGIGPVEVRLAYLGAAPMTLAIAPGGGQLVTPYLMLPTDRCGQLLTITVQNQAVLDTQLIVVYAAPGE